MKLKKPMKIKSPPGASGGATIADRFRLDTEERTGDSSQESGGGKIATAFALAAALAAFAAAAGLAALLHSHLGFFTLEA